MTALLELPAVRERVHLMSVEDYHRLGELGVLSHDVELLRGIGAPASGHGARSDADYFFSR